MEKQYLDLIKNVFKNGKKRSERTGVGVIGIFAPPQITCDLTNNFPLLTTKPVFYRGVIEELLWFIRGETNEQILSSKGVMIWSGNSSREYLDSVGLTNLKTGDLGPIYGWQWRHFGATYIDCFTDYSNCGIDQLKNVLYQIVNNPTDRRIILSAWNPMDLKNMALPPCHMFCQFYVDDDKLSCLLYQRSCDIGLGVPFNISSYSFLLCMIAYVTGLKPFKFIHTMGDTHIYNNHISGLQQLLKRQIKTAPKLKITKQLHPIRTVDNMLKELENFTIDDFEIIDYKPHSKIILKMAV